MSLAPAVLVTDGEQRAALAIVRSLGRAGYRPYVGSARGRSLAGASRYVEGEAAFPDPLADPEGFAEAVQQQVSRWGIEILLPVTDAALLAILSRPERFDGIRIPFPDLERFRRISDKSLLLRTAPEVGISIPEQRVLADVPARAALGDQTLHFPLVIKPARSVTETATGGGRTKLAVQHAVDRRQLEALLDQLPADAYPILLQRRIVGPGVGIFLLVWEGRTVAAFAHRRIREKPPSGGVSVYRESIAADPGLVAKSKALLDRFAWSGVAMIEYKVDEASGTPYLMEINGRFWGSLQLAIDAGVDFPLLLADLARGGRPEPVTVYRVGVRSRWWWGDVDHLLARIRRSDAELALPPGSPGRLRALLDFLILWRPGDHNEILRWDDPMPLVRETIEWLHRR